MVEPAHRDNNSKTRNHIDHHILNRVDCSLCPSISFQWSISLPPFLTPLAIDLTSTLIKPLLHIFKIQNQISEPNHQRGRELNLFTSMVVCDLELGRVRVDGNLLQCNEATEVDVSEFQVIGSSLTNSIEIFNSNVTLFFKNVVVNTASAVSVNSSTVLLVFDGSSSFSSSGERSPGLGCSDDSNITIQVDHYR
jgi:hypothetical protein